MEAPIVFPPELRSAKPLVDVSPAFLAWCMCACLEREGTTNAVCIVLTLRHHRPLSEVDS